MVMVETAERQAVRLKDRVWKIVAEPRVRSKKHPGVRELVISDMLIRTFNMNRISTTAQRRMEVLRQSARELEMQLPDGCEESSAEIEDVGAGESLMDGEAVEQAFACASV